jgi:hypothetical protein
MVVKSVAIFALGVLVTATAAQACDRHIYNHSAKPWTFRATNSIGNFYFTTGLFACKNRKNGPCTIPAHTSIATQYTTTGGLSNGTIFITDWRGQTRSFDYRGAASNCPSISHNGNTGAVAVNDPADGDLNAWANDWSSGMKAAPPPHR